MCTMTMAANKPADRARYRIDQLIFIIQSHTYGAGYFRPNLAESQSRANLPFFVWAEMVYFPEFVISGAEHFPNGLIRL